MILKNYVEAVKRIFPDASYQEIVKQFDLSQKKFCRETKILQDTAELSTPATNIAWALPSNFEALDRVDYYNEDGYPLYDGVNFDLGYDIANGYIRFKSFNGNVLDGGLPSDIDSVFIAYRKKPSGLTSISSSWTIEEDYRDYVKHDVIAQLYLTNPVIVLDRNGNAIKAIDSTSSARHLSLYKLGVNATIKERNIDGDMSHYEAINYNFAGQQTIKKYQKPSSAGSILSASTALRAIYSKYAKIILENPNSYTLEDGSFGFDGTWTDSWSVISGGDQLVLTSDQNDFMLGVTQIDPTNEDVEYSIDSQTQITFKVWDTWTKVTIEIWER